jgi:hypothetical protein
MNAAWAEETSLIPVSLDEQIVRLELRIYRPPVSRRLPTLVFNHGSTGNGRWPIPIYGLPLSSAI